MCACLLRHGPDRAQASRALALVVAVTFLASAAGAAAPAGTTVPAVDLFAPVAAQQARWAAALERQPAGRVTPERVELLLHLGRVDAADSLLGGLQGDPRAAAVARAEVYLTRQDYPAAGPLIADMVARQEPTDAERRLRFVWLFAHDDAAAVDSLTRALSLVPGTTASTPGLLAAGRLAYDLLQYARAESCFTRVLERTTERPPTSRAERGPGPATEERARARAAALVGLGLVDHQRRDFDRSLARLAPAVAADATADGLQALAQTLVRLGRNDEAITAAEWATRLDPYHERAHYLRGNGYTVRKNYTQLHAAYPGVFADSSGCLRLAAADSLLAGGDRAGARAAYEAVRASHPGWADPLIRLASLDFEEGRFESARDLAFAALRICPEYGRAHGVLAKALQFQRFAVDVHRAGYEARFAAAAMPEVPGIERFVLNWRSLSPRQQKRVALSVAPWKQFLPVLIEGGATYYIKPLYMLLSSCPGLETLHDQRIDYDSRLWDDVRGSGGYHTVTGIEDVELTVFDRYNTVLHELTHQVHGVLTADQDREIQEYYRRAKERDAVTHGGFLSRYAAGAVEEYLAEGANALLSPKRDAYDPREEVRERLDAIDPDLRSLVERLMAITDVSASYPVAYVNAGDDRVERGQVNEAVAFYEKALARSPREETALQSLTRALTLAGDGSRALAAAERAMSLQPASGPVVVASADAYWRGGRGLEAALSLLEKSRTAVRAEDRYRVDSAIGQECWVRGDGARSLAAFDSVLAYQSDRPEGLWGRAAALALAKRWDAAFAAYDQAVRLRTGVTELRCDYARDLLRAGRLDSARTQLGEAKLLDPESPTAEALRGWTELEAGNLEAARAHCTQALAWGPWCDLARIVLGAAEQTAGNAVAARAAWNPVEERLARGDPPGYVYRPKLAVWESIHELPAVERELLKEYEAK